MIRDEKEKIIDEIIKIRIKVNDIISIDTEDELLEIINDLNKLQDRVFTL